MNTNQIFGLILVLFGLFDFFFLPKLFQTIWKKAQKEPQWAGAALIVVRAVGVILIFFGVSYYFFGQLD